MSSSSYWGFDDLDMLASDLDTNLSGLGGTTTSSFDMSEALSVLKVLKANEDEDHLASKPAEMSCSLNKLDSSFHETGSFSVPKSSSKLAKKPCRKSLLDCKQEQCDMSTHTSPEHHLEDGSLLRVASAPSLSQSLYKSAFQPGISVKENANDSTGFQYVLAAPTALGTKIGEETLTYLNQGQSYEVRLKKLNGLGEIKGKLLKSVVRVGFQEKRLQFREKVEILGWQTQRPLDRILDIDLALSYGIFDVKSDSKEINRSEFVWDPNREASVFLRINCISTEFTSKRKGGEKGVVFRILIDTYSHWQDPPQKLHTASCLVKVFKAKGADRKHKTDREKLEKLPQSEQRDMQPSYQYTVFTQYTNSAEESFSQEFHPNDGSFSSSSERGIKPDMSPSRAADSPMQSFTLQDDKLLFKCKEEYEEGPVSEEIRTYSTSSQVCSWLVANRFSKFLSHFSSFSGSDLLRLSRDDLIEICGTADGIRFYNALHVRSVRPKLILYLSSEGQTFHAVCLYDVSLKELKKQMCEVCQLKEPNLKDMFLIGPSDILIHMSDKLVKSFKNESVYIFEIARADEDDMFCIVLQSYCCKQVIQSPGLCYIPTKDTNL